MADGVTTTRPVRGRSLNDNTGMDTTRHRGVAGFPRSNCRCQHRRRRSIYSFGDILGNIHAGVVAHIGHDNSGRHPADGGRIAGWAKVAHPTNGEVVVVDLIGGRRRLPWRGGWSDRGGRPPRQMRYEHMLSFSSENGDTGMFRQNHE